MKKVFAREELCICTGSKPFVPPMENATGKVNALTFLDLASTKEVKKHLENNGIQLLDGSKSLISNRVSIDTLQGDIMDDPSVFMFDRETRITKLRGGVQI